MIVQEGRGRKKVPDWDVSNINIAQKKMDMEVSKNRFWTPVELHKFLEIV